MPDGGFVRAEYVVPARFQSWKGMVHGGLVALLLDEAVGWAAWHANRPGVTAKLQVRYRRPLEVGQRVRISGRVTRIRRSLVEAEAWVENARGERVAEGTASLMAVPTEVADGLADLPARAREL